MPDRHWNYRLLKLEDHGAYGGLIEIVEVHYDGERPMGYSKAFMVGETQGELKGVLERMQEAFDKPVLTEADFPNRTVPEEEALA